MQALLERQTKALEVIQKDIKQDKIIQLAQLYEEKRLDEESSQNVETLKSLDKGIKKLNETSGNNLNSNVIKLFKEIQKVSSPKRNLNDEEVKSITGVATERRQFNTLQPRVESFKDSVKDLFTMRGFLDKTGIAQRGSGGLISEYLDRGEAKKKYVDQRMKTKGTTFGSRETFARQFDEQQKVQYDINKNEKEIRSLRESGATDIGLKRSGLLDKRAQLAANLAKVDPSVRPEGFDPKTGKVKVAAPETATEQQAKAKSAGKGKVIPFSGSTEAAGSSLGNEETMLEQNRMVAEQSELLKKIEENTRGLKGGTQGSGTTQKTQEEAAGGLGLADMLGGSKLGKIAKSAGRGLLSGAKSAGSFMLRRAGPLAAVAAVGAGAYEGYKGWSDAGDKQDAAKDEIRAKLDAGEITQGEASQLTKQVNETATVEKAGAAGKGTGMALGGAAGALKGAAAGAAIGSVVPVVGTVIGGAIGATVGAIGGGWLGGKGGEWAGKKLGQAKNWLFGSSGEVAPSKGSSVSINFSESEFAKNDSENYQKFASDREELAKKYADDNAKKFGRKEPSPVDRKSAYMKANTETIEKYRKEIEAAGAGKVTGGKISSQNLSGADTSTSAAQVSPASAPSTGNVISKASGDNEQAKLDATRGGGGNTVVSAPTINNNTQNQTSSVKLSPRNNDSTVNKYMQSRWAF